MAKFPDIDAMQIAVVSRYAEHGFRCENSKQLTHFIGRQLKGEDASVVWAQQRKWRDIFECRRKPQQNTLEVLEYFAEGVTEQYHHLFWKLLRYSQFTAKAGDKFLLQLDRQVVARLVDFSVGDDRGLLTLYPVNWHRLRRLECKAGLDALACLFILLVTARERCIQRDVRVLTICFFRVLVVVCDAYRLDEHMQALCRRVRPAIIQPRFHGRFTWFTWFAWFAWFAWFDWRDADQAIRQFRRNLSENVRHEVSQACPKKAAFILGEALGSRNSANSIDKVWSKAVWPN